MSRIEKAIERLEKIAAENNAGQPEDNPPERGQGDGDQHAFRASSEGNRKPTILQIDNVLSPILTGDADNSHAVSSGAICKIDLELLELNGYLTPDSGRSRLAEEYQMIKRPLLMNAFGKGAGHVERGNLVMLVSALPGEGKTFSCLNLAMSMTMERDTTVLIVDSDVLKPSLTRLLGLEDEPGLTDVLIDSHINLRDVIKNTDIPKLRVLPAGRPHE